MLESPESAFVGSLVTAALYGLGRLALYVYRGRGGYAKDVAAASVVVSESEHKVKREDEEAGRKQESAILREYKILVAEQKEDLADQREQIHELRGDLQTLNDKFTAAQIKLAVCEHDLMVCKADRAQANERLAALEADRESRGGPGPHRPLLSPEGEPPC